VAQKHQRWRSLLVKFQGDLIARPVSSHHKWQNSQRQESKNVTGSIKLSNDEYVTLHALRKSRGWTPAEVGLQTATNIWHGCGMAHQRVPHTTTLAAMGKAQSPTTDNRVWSTGSDDVDADRRRDLWAGRAVTLVPFHCSIWKLEQRVCTKSVLELWANVADEGAEWCGQTSTMKIAAGKQCSSLTGAAWLGM